MTPKPSDSFSKTLSVGLQPRVAKLIVFPDSLKDVFASLMIVGLASSDPNIAYDSCAAVAVWYLLKNKGVVTSPPHELTAVRVPRWGQIIEKRVNQRCTIWIPPSFSCKYSATSRR